MSDISRAPARLSSGLAFALAILALAASGYYSWTAFIVGTLGAVVFFVGMGRARRSGVTVGAFFLFLSAILAGGAGGPVEFVLVSATASVLAYDVGSNAIGIGRQLGTEAPTLRIELVHAVASIVIGGLTAGIGYSLYLAGPEGLPVVAVFFLVIAAVLLIVAVDRGR